MKYITLILALISIGHIAKSQENRKVEGANTISTSADTSHERGTITEISAKKPLYFLGSDQSDNKVRLFSDTINDLGELAEHSRWHFLPNHMPTDAKRVDHQGEISVIIASHGSIYQIPINYQDKYVYAETHPSCHSVEILPDGNMISANSNGNKLTLHFNKQEEVDKFRFIESFDILFEYAHGVVYDKQRDVVWALGFTIGKFKYNCCPTPELTLLNEYQLPTPHSDGHDLFPDENGDLLVTSDQGVLKFTIDSLNNPLFSSLIYSDHNIKSVVSDIYSNDLYITSPTDIAGYETWQTNKIINVSQSTHYVRPSSKFYKVRLWQKNNFSYD